METTDYHWTQQQASSFNLPSVGQCLVLLAIIGFWKFPRVCAFDPTPRPSSNSNKNSVLINSNIYPTKTTLSVQQSDKQPPARSLSEWETESSLEDNDDNDSRRIDCYESTKNNLQEPSLFLKEQAPDSTLEERYRFLKARNGNEPKALENLQIYLDWRKQHQTLIQQQEEKFTKDDDDDPDLHDWIVASQTALQANQESTNNGWKWVPRVVQTHCAPNQKQGPALDYDGNCIIHMTPAKMDDRVCSVETYSLAIALYIDRKLDRHSKDQITLLIDTRPGEGWRNISAIKLLPFIKHIVQLMLTLFPERLYRTVLYPLPSALTWLFRSIQRKFMDPVTARKIVVVAGSAAMDSPLPKETLCQYVSEEVALVCEEERLASFSSSRC